MGMDVAGMFGSEQGWEGIDSVRAPEITSAELQWSLEPGSSLFDI